MASGGIEETEGVFFNQIRLNELFQGSVEKKYFFLDFLSLLFVLLFKDKNYGQVD